MKSYQIHLLNHFKTNFILFTVVAAIFISACDRDSPDKIVTFEPLMLDDWEVSAPAEQGLDPELVQDMYQDANQIVHLYGLLVIKNGYQLLKGWLW